MLVFSPLTCTYETSMCYSFQFFKWMISLWTDLNLFILTEWLMSPDKLALRGNYWTGQVYVSVKFMFQLFTQRRMTVGCLVQDLAMTQIERILTWATKGITSRIQPSQSDRTNFSLSNLESKSLRMDLPLPACYQFRQVTFSISIAPKRSLAFSTPIQSLHPQLGPCWCYITIEASLKLQSQGLLLLIAKIINNQLTGNKTFKQTIIEQTPKSIQPYTNNKTNMGCVMPPGTSQSTILKQRQIQRMKKQLQHKNHQISLLEQHNHQLKTQKAQQLQQISKQIRQHDIILIDFQEDGQCDDANQPQLAVASLLKCNICQEDYDVVERLPWMVCNNQHTYCSVCINDMLRRAQNNCPECRQAITAGNRNAHLCLLIQNTMGKQQPHKKSSGPPKQFPISINKSTRFFSQYNISQPNNVILKTSDANWYGLLCNEVIPAEGVFKFCAEVMFSIHNNIEIGIIDVASKVQKNKMSNKRVTYHLHDGRVMDSGSVDKHVTGWKNRGKKVEKGTNAKIVVICDMDNNKIEWHVNGELKAEGIISDFLKYSKAVPYISLFHTDDIVVLNAW